MYGHCNFVLIDLLACFGFCSVIVHDLRSQQVYLDQLKHTAKAKKAIELIMKILL